MIHIHGSVRCNKSGPAWPGMVTVGVIIVVTVITVIKIGWIVLAPFGFGALNLALLLWIMRVTEKPMDHLHSVRHTDHERR